MKKQLKRVLEQILEARRTLVDMEANVLKLIDEIEFAEQSAGMPDRPMEPGMTRAQAREANRLHKQLLKSEKGQR